MKSTLLSLLLCLSASSIFAQQSSVTGTDKSYQDEINIDEISSINVFASDTFNQIIQEIILQKNIVVPDEGRYAKVYFTSKAKDKYLKIWSGPDLGYGWFYTIGYTNKGACADCGTLLSHDTRTDYIVNNGIKLGSDVKKVWEQAHLNYFRKFSFQGITYYYFEKGTKQEVPFAPERLFYYKFDRKGKLIEIGFGYGMTGENPMLHR